MFNILFYITLNLLALIAGLIVICGVEVWRGFRGKKPLTLDRILKWHSFWWDVAVFASRLKLKPLMTSALKKQIKWMELYRILEQRERMEKAFKNFASMMHQMAMSFQSLAETVGKIQTLHKIQSLN